MGQVGEAFSFSGILKIIEIVLGFITVIIHRYGDNGKLIFFGTSAIQLSPVRYFLKQILKRNSEQFKIIL